jgi:phosphopantetheine adenylyltransferase
MLCRNVPCTRSTHNLLIVVSGLIWRYAKNHGARVFVRGIRSWEKDGADERSLQILNTWGPIVLGRTWPLPTLYLEGKPEFNHISSTLIRILCKDGKPPKEALSQLVPSSIADRVANLYSRQED